MTITNWGEIREEEVRPGIFCQEFSAGALQVIKYKYESGSVFERHSHPEEQMTLLLEGELTFTLSSEKYPLTSGAVLHITGGTEHSAENTGTEAALTLNFFTPPKRI